MDDELKSLVEETRNLALENNKMLKSIQRRARTGMLMTAIYWVLILGLSVGVFYYVEPYFDEVKGFYQGIKDVQQKASDFSDKFGSFKNFMPGK